MPIGRRRARREALFVLYQMDLMGLVAEDALGRIEGPVDPYSRRLVVGVRDQRDDLDARLRSRLKGWTLERLAPLERNILRLALFELLAVEEVPAEVAVAEAVALAKRYCSDEAASLVNGVLGALSEVDDTGGGAV